MHGTFERLRAAHPGKWLLIRKDDRDSETGTLIFAHEDSDRVGEELLRQPKEEDKERPLYTTYSWTKEDEEFAYAL